MGNLYTRMRSFKLPTKDDIESAISSFSKKEHVVFLVLIGILVLSTLVILQSINKSFLVRVPMPGGSVSEAIIGTPRFINPTLAISDADRDLTALIYSGLMRRGPDNTFLPDLADRFEISKDNLAYTFTLRDDIYFQDKTPVTADDVIFTVNSVKDPVLKSPYRSNFYGVNAEKVDEKTVKFTLKQPSATFLESMTLGIMPKHVWANSPIELNDANINPVGSGPYEVAKINKESSGTIDSYELRVFKNWNFPKPYLKNINLYFFSNENDAVSALLGGKVSQLSSVAPEDAKMLEGKGYRIESAVLPRIFGLFFNQNQNQLFTDKAVVRAINTALDKENIIREVLSGYGTVIDGPIPPGIMAGGATSVQENLSPEERLDAAKNILAKDGWKEGPDGFLQKTTTVNKKKTNEELGFSISTGNTPDLIKAADLIQKSLAALGMKVDVKVFETGNLNQSVIRPRKYDALLFGQIVNNESDLLAFWHSSQRKDPGLNIAMYTNARADKLLEDASMTIDNDARMKKYAQFEDEINKDMPAVFLYSPDFIYVVSPNLKGLDISHVISPSDRFLDIASWYTQTDNVWKIFAQ